MPEPLHPLDLTPSGHCHCGCGIEVMKHRRFLKGHGGHSGARPPIEIDPATNCWEWFGKRDPAGYGRVKRAGRYQLAHRWVYERLVAPLQTHEILDHLCRNRRCVNPYHLEPVTDAINVRRGSATKLTLEQVDQIRVRSTLRPMAQSQRKFAGEIAAEYGVAESTVRSLLGGFTWGPPKLRERG